ncbi:hypothetical protein QQF64_008690 [Cirrhinus molitorella]|uniref:Uncharacterized protein n=1 Tax=Cirrhinus molitorella TaxID=172907 RepID=A0ABR3M6X1_9TELE
MLLVAHSSISLLLFLSPSPPYLPDSAAAPLISCAPAVQHTLAPHGPTDALCPWEHFLRSRELQEEVDNTATISFYTEDWAQVNRMGLLSWLTNRQDHTAHLWDSGRPLHPIVNMTNEKKYPIKQAFVCAMLQESGICLALSS